MVTCKTIRLLGTSGLANSNKLLVYNSNSFLGRVGDLLGLSDYEKELLGSEPDITTIDDIYRILTSHDEFITLENLSNEENKHFKFDNDRLNSISGEGFNTLIFLEDDEIIGFIVLLSPLGNSTTTLTTKYKLNKTYLVKYIDIYVDSKNNGIRVDEDTIRLLDSIPTDTGIVKDGVTKADIINESRTFYKSNYNYHINSHLKSIDSKDIFTDQVYVGKNVVSKLKLKKDINLGEEYSNFQHEQIGYYKGDPVLFIWDDNCRYSILSLTVFIDDLFKTSGLNKPKSYTYPRRDSSGTLISSTDIYTIPKVSENVINQKILYFSGRYVIVKADEETYLFDVDNQQGEYSGDNKYEQNNGWVPSISTKGDEITYYLWREGNWVVLDSIKNVINIRIYNNLEQVLNPREDMIVGVRGGKKELTTTFIADSFDPYNRLARLDSLTWQTYKEAIQKYYPFSNVYNNLEWCILSDTIPYRKIGEWIVFKNKTNSTFMYSNLTKTVKFRSNEEEPIVVNDQVLIGRNGNTYTIYDEPGYFMSKAASELENQNEVEIFSHQYKVYDETSYSRKFYKVTNDPTVLDIQRSFLGSFRRNIVPSRINEDFKLIGALSGIIYYRVGNYINFL